MAHTHEHLEHAEHHAHHAPVGFATKVAVTMAIVAACLAGISMVGHRTHNKVLQQLGDANRLGTEAAAAEVEKSNLFAWYQSKRLRQASYQMAMETAALLPAGDEAARRKQVDRWKAKADEYNQPDDKREGLPQLIERGNEAGRRAEELRGQAAAARHEAEHTHHQADRLDVAHLAAELGLVLCSIALLTKRKEFWLAGILAAVVGLGLTGSAYLIPHHPAPTAAH